MRAAVGGAIIGLAALLAAPRAPALPGAMQLGGKPLAAAGCGVRHTLWIEHYEAVLYLPRPGSPAAQLVDPASAKALRIRIIDKRFLPSDLPGKWREPMQRHLDPATLARVRDAYRALRPGDQVTLAYAPTNGILLQVEGGPSATVPGHGLIDAILGTWADGKPLREELQRTLARNPCRRRPGVRAEGGKAAKPPNRLC